MHRYNNLPRRPGRTALRRRQGLKQSLALTCLTLPLVVTLIIFTCAIIVGAVSRTASLVALRPTITRTSLPTFTPTSLPTFTPTTSSIQLVGTSSPPPTATAAPLPTQTNAHIAPPAAAGNQNNTRPTLTSRVPLNVRSGPGLEHDVVGQLAVGQSTGITGQNPDGSWWQIEYPLGSGRQAWVSADPQYSTVSQTMPQTIAQASTPTSRPVAAVTATSPLSTSAPPPQTPTPFPGTSGWSFSRVTNLAGNSRKGMLLLTGELVNDTGAPQHEIDISGVFYNGQDEVAIDNLNLVSYVPVDPIPVNAHIPFELQVNGNQDIDHFDLYARSEPASDPPRQDFQFSDVEQWVSDAIGYCLRGQVDNQGPPVQEYLLVLVIGYDDQGSVVNFGEYYVDNLPANGAQSSPFEMCLDPLDRQLSRHDLIAFGY